MSSMLCDRFALIYTDMILEIIHHFIGECKWIFVYICVCACACIYITYVCIFRWSIFILMSVNTEKGNSLERSVCDAE